MSDRKKDFEVLLKSVKSDPKLLHDLIFNTESVLEKIDVDRKTKANILTLNPENVIAGLAGLVQNADNSFQYCGSSCSSSCTDTCGAGSCDSTCGAGSCTSTCGSISCGQTSALTDRGRFLEVEQLGADLGNRAFRRFMR